MSLPAPAEKPTWFRAAPPMRLTRPTSSPCPLVATMRKPYNKPITLMSPFPDDLTILKDDMVAFIEGHGMRRFHGYVDYGEVQSVMWKPQDDDNPDSWKDFVELAKAAGAPFLTMDSWRLQRGELDAMIESLSSAEFTSD